MPRTDPQRRGLEEAAAGVLASEDTPDDQLIDDAVSRQERALRLRLSGASYRDIAERLGYGGPSGAFKAVSAALQRTVVEPSDELRNLELARLDRVQLALWKIVTARDAAPEDVVKASNAYMRLSKRRADLLGLDAPKKIDITARVRELALQEGLDPDQAEQDAREVMGILEAAGAGDAADWRA